MLKNKDDEFLGDEITNNIKYADNEWQAQGTIDRGSVYTKEPLLDLLFEGFDYSKLIGDYSQYVARASTADASGNASKPYVAAKLQHDLYVLDMEYYSASSTSSVNNIFALSTYLQKAVSIANPTYDSKSVAKAINLLGITVNPDKTLTWTNPALKDVLLKDVLKYLYPPYYFENSTERLSQDFVKFLNRYRSTVSVKNKDLTVLQFGENPNSTFDKNTPSLYSALGRVVPYLEILFAKDLELFEQREAILNDTFGKFIEGLNTKIWSNPSYPEKPAETIAESFIRDFTIYIHNPKDIKIPFYNRGKTRLQTSTASDEYDETEDVRSFKTRFIANSLSRNLMVSGTSLSKPIYVDNLTEILEDAIFGPAVAGLDSGLLAYDARMDLDASISTSKELKSDLLSDTGKYRHLFDQKDMATATLLADYVKIIDNMDTAISLYCPEVYTGYSSTNTPETSWGIHFLNEESTENLFQDTDNTYKLYNNVIIGYRLADALIALRTGMSGLYYLLHERDSTETVPTTIDIPLYKFTGVSNFFDCLQSDETKVFTFYPTLSAINVLYKLGHGGDIELTERKGAIDRTDNDDKEYVYSYSFADEIKEWLSQECFIFKGNVYGDYVEELNFLQDLTPDSDVHFNSIRAKKTEITHKRHQDSKYEVPYIDQTAPLLNPNKDNSEGIGVYGSDAIGGTGNLKAPEGKNGNSQNILPPFLYDYDKGNQKDWMDKNVDPRVKSALTQNAQMINPLNNKGVVVAEDSIKSPTIDALWTFLKYLTESDGSFVDKGFNERLPKFYGIERAYIEDTLFDKDTNIQNRNTVNPRATTANTRTVDILNWSPIKSEEKNLHYSPASGRHVECQFGGYQVTRYIEKIYDYEVKPFSRRANLEDDSVYEYNTEVSNDFNNVTGYLEKLYNSAILAFDLPAVDVADKTKAAATIGILGLDVLSKTGEGNFTIANDKKLTTNTKAVHNTEQRQKALKAIAEILNYHKADGETPEASKHNHYKKYLENPKNLKEIERDLETIRQNLQTLAEFSVASFASLGYADRAQNRGTLHQLHKNAYDFASTFITDVNNTIANLEASAYTEAYNVRVQLLTLGTDLNNIEDDLKVTALDKRVVFDDGNYDERYLRENYDASVIDLNTNVVQNTRSRHPMYRANETLLSEVYMAADGTWRSVHEHTVLPVIYSAH